MKVALILLLGAAASQVSSDPLSQIPAIPVAKTSISGRTIATIADGDFVHPAFSPDGKKLAYSRVVLGSPPPNSLAERLYGKMGKMELAEVLVRDMTSMDVVTLLDAEASKEYAAYGSYVSWIAWNDNETLEVVINDGDVGSTAVTFDVATKRIRTKEFFEGDVGDLTFCEDEPCKEASRVFGWRPELMANAIRNGFRVGEKAFIVQKNYYGEDTHIWYLDVGRKEQILVLRLPDNWIYALGYGFHSGGYVVFPVWHGDKAHILVLREGNLARLAGIPSPRRAWLQVKYKAVEGVVFMVGTSRRWPWDAKVKADNPLFVLADAGFKKVTDLPTLHDVEIAPTGQWICFSVWEGDERHLIVRELRIE